MRPRFDPWVGKIPCRREGLATLVFLPGEFHAQKNLAGYTPWGHKDSDMTEQLTPSLWGFPGGANGNKSACQCRRCKRCRFHPWVGRLPWSRKWQPTSVFLPGEFYGPRSLQPVGPRREGHNWATNTYLLITTICWCYYWFFRFGYHLIYFFFYYGRGISSYLCLLG